MTAPSSSSPVSAQTQTRSSTTANPFDTPAETDSETAIIKGMGTGASNADRSECGNHQPTTFSRRCLDSPFFRVRASQIDQPLVCQNLNRSSADNSSSQRQYPGPNEGIINREIVLEDYNNSNIENYVGAKNELEGNNKDDDDDNNNHRRTTVTRVENTWDENSSHSENDDNDVESNPHTQDTNNEYRHRAAAAITTASHREKCLDCLMRIVRRMCHPHIHPPCSRRYWSNNNNSEQYRRRLSPRHRRILCRSLIILFMIVTITFTLLDLLILHQYLHQWLDSTLEWLHSYPISGGLAFIGIILMGCLCFFPVALLSLGAGYVYIELYGLGLGIFIAFLVCLSGYLLGASVCFARSRFLMRQLIIRYSAKYPIVKAVDRAFETKGFRLLLLLRLSPAMPMNALNYIGGITAISFSSYWWATCVGTSPGLLFTIFVGATFGTVDARGVDGNKEFDRDSLRKGVVLGLGIGLGVMALIGTAIYARMELKKIILAEQMERVIEEHDLFMHNESEEGREDREDDDHGLVLFESTDNPQTGDWDDLSNNRRRLSSHGSLITLERHRGINQHPWTPETVDAELPILPKVIFRCLGRQNDEVTTSAHERGEEANPTSAWSDMCTPKNRQRAVSASPFPRQRHSFDAPKFHADASHTVGVNIISPSTRRHSDDIARDALMVTPEGALRADTSANTVSDMMSSLANIYETRTLSDDQLFDEADVDASHSLGSPHVNNQSICRRRCNTDPTDRRKHESEVAEAGKIRWRQSSPVHTPPPRQQQGMNSRHSFGSLQRNQGVLAEFSPQRPRCHSLNTHLQEGMSQHESSISLPHQLSPPGGHVGLDISGRDDDDLAREWFWIWS